MKKLQYIFYLLPAIMFAACEETDIPEPEAPQTSIVLSIDGEEIPSSEVLEIYKGESQTIEYSGTGISKITASCPTGWECEVSRAAGTVEIFAPEYYDTSAPAEADIVLEIYDGSGGTPKEFTIHAKAVEESMTFSMDTVAQPVIFTLGSQQIFTFAKNASVKELKFDLPKGWTAEEKDDGTFVITAPDLSQVEGDISGTVTVTPVSWSGEEGTSLSAQIAVRMTNEATFQFVDQEVSFAYGETKTLNVIAKGLKSFTQPQLPKGWTGDFSNILGGSVTITAPAKDADMVGRDSIKVEALSYTNEPVTSTTLSIRLYGINDYEELLEFREVYGATVNEPVTEGLDKYLVDGELALNSDIDIPESGMASVKAYFIKYLVLPLNGNGHTITVQFKSDFHICAIFQYIKGVKVSNLNIAGSFINNANNDHGSSGTLACTARDGCYFENVHSSADFTYKPQNTIGYNDSNVGGIIGQIIGIATFKNCSYSGKIELQGPVGTCAGIASKTDASKPGYLNTFENCEFSGEITYSQSGSNGRNTRLGGIVGDLARQAELKNCVFSGKITMNMNGFAFFGSSSGKGVGGLVGRITSPVSGYTMKATLTDCTSSGTISINQLSSSDPRNCVGLSVGCKPGSSASILTETGTVITGSLTFN